MYQLSMVLIFWMDSRLRGNDNPGNQSHKKEICILRERLRSRGHVILRLCRPREGGDPYIN